MRIIEFDSGHDTTGTIDMWNGKCSVCNKKTEVLAISVSSEEYDPGCICLVCINKAFNAYYIRQTR